MMHNNIINLVIYSIENNAHISHSI